MKQDFFEFDPTFKLLVYSNHKPRIRMADEAMRRRLDLVQFDVVIPEKERDQLLSEKLRKEGPGILAWAIRGCIEWQRVGLKSPQRVRDATDAYLRSQDLFNSWMEENCETGANRRENRTSLFRSFAFYCKEQGGDPGAANDFYSVMEQRGHPTVTVKGVRLLDRIKLRSRDYDDRGLPF